MYRNFLIQSAVGVPGSIIACYTVDLKYIGRKGTMAISTLISGIFLYLFTLSSSSGYQTFCASIEAFFQVSSTHFFNHVPYSVFAECHVRCPLRLHARSVSCTEPWYGNGHRLSTESDRGVAGACFRGAGWRCASRCAHFCSSGVLLGCECGYDSLAY